MMDLMAVLERQRTAFMDELPVAIDVLAEGISSHHKLRL